MTDLSGRHFLVTGANTGIGKETARGLAKRGARVTLAGRSEDKTRAAMADIAAETSGADLEFLQLDLSDFESVRKAASEFLAREEPLHVLINNAGLAGGKGMTASGFETAFGTNHMGPFLFTQLLLDRLKQADAARIVNVASTMHYQAKGIDWDAVRRPAASRVGMKEYSESKLANVLHAQELARRLAGTNVTTYSLHPGVIASDVYRQVPWPRAQGDDHVHEVDRGRREDEPALRHVARGGGRNRALLRRIEAQEARVGGYAGARRRALGAQRSLGQRGLSRPDWSRWPVTGKNGEPVDVASDVEAKPF